MAAEPAMARPQANEHQGFPATTGSWKGQERTLSWKLQGEHGPADPLISDFQPP